MASALITISGTSGEVLINYKISTTPHKVIADIGTVYIEDTATDVTYTTLSGDAIASSSALTITSLPYVCYKLSWKGIKANGYKIKAVVLDSNTYTIADVQFPKAGTALPQAINDLDIANVIAIQYNIVYPTYPDINPENVEYNYIIKVTGTAIPFLKIANADESSYIYIHGVSSACSVSGYTNINLCDVTV